MKVLVVDGFDSTPSGRRNFKDFFDGVKYAFESETNHWETHTANGSTQYDVEKLSSLHKYVYAYERNEFTDPSAINLFDKIDCIFLDVDRRLLPWGQKSRTLLLLIKTAFFTNKAVFAAGAGLQFVTFVMSTGGKRLRVLNGEAGTDIKMMKKFRVPNVVGPDDVFLDSASGDFFEIKEGTGKSGYVWSPAGSIGSHVHDTTANLVSQKYAVKPPSSRKKTFAAPPHKTVPKYKNRAIMIGETKVHILKSNLRHKAFANFGDNWKDFIAYCDNTWNLDTDTNGRNKHRYKVIAESSQGPQFIEYNNVWGVQFHIRKKFPMSYEIMRNFARHVYEKQSREGKVGISCDFLRNGDPNLKPKRGLVRPFSAPVKRQDVFRTSEDQVPGSKQSSRQSSNSSVGVGVRGETATANATAAGPQTARSRSSKSTQNEVFDPIMIAQEGYATPRVVTAKDAMTPRSGVKISAHQDDVETVQGGMSDVVMSSGRTTARTSGSEFSKKLLQLGGKVGVDMTFAKNFNEAAREEARLQRERQGYGSGDESTKGDDQYFDDVYEGDYSESGVGVDSWGPGEAQVNNENNPPNNNALDLSNLHGAIAWGENIKVDEEPVRLNSSQNPRPRTAQDERNQSRKEGKVKTVKTPRQAGYNNYNKYVKMQKKDNGSDWYLYNDGTPYVSKSERELKEENHHRKRGGLKGESHEDFVNYCGKRSTMSLPDKHGVAAHGKYYGKVECSSQIEEVEGRYHHKDKFVGKGKQASGWTYTGDRQKPYWAERKGRRLPGYSQGNGQVGWD
ncbi:hypothetical protein TrLO_g6446 [Triparma laevis f. longispina]|uniref:Uncharacterized protein n=1 Tax=Triparma laevis f. longispina TaxID=1714387 RepID=A0A9W7A1L6_9STRA|nr:hypothetical protein TrLO_g6446 [Triparma laevis f. longispina]